MSGDMPNGKNKVFIYPSPFKRYLFSGRKKNHTLTCGCNKAAMKKLPASAIKNIADGEPTPSSDNWMEVPTSTAIMNNA